MTVEIARQLRLGGNINQALVALKNEADYGTAEFQAELFQLRLARAEVAEAEQAVRSVLVLAPSRAPSLLCQLAQLQRRTGDLDAAQNSLLDAQRLVASQGAKLPEWFEAELAGVYMAKGLWQEAYDTAMAGFDRKPVLGLTAVRALVNIGRISDAHEVASRTFPLLNGEPSRAQAVAAACAALIKADAGSKTRHIIEQAAEMFSRSVEIKSLIADLEFQDANWAAASARYRELLAAAETSNPVWLKKLSIALSRVGDAPEIIDAAFRAAALASKNDCAVVNEWVAWLRSREPASDPTSAIEQLQRDTDEIVPSLIMQLSGTRSSEALLEAFPLQVARFRASDAFSACEASLASATQFSVIDPALAAKVASLPHNVLNMYFFFREPAVRRVHLYKTSNADLGFLHMAGIKIDCLRSFFESFLACGTLAWQAYLNDALFASPSARDHVLHLERFTGYQDRVVRDRRLEIADPLTGKLCSPFDSVIIYDRQVFSFRGRTLFMFLTGGAGGKAFGLYVPAHNLLFDLGADLPRYVSDVSISNVLSIMLRRFAEKPDAYLESATAAGSVGSTRDIVAFHGKIENFAHHVWNFFTGWERLALAGTTSNIKRILYSGTQYYGPFGMVFDEFSSTPIEQINRSSVIDPCGFSSSEIVLQPGGYFIPKTLKARLRNASRRFVSKDVAQSLVRAEARYPVVWLGLRFADKAWIGQASGIPRVIRRVHAAHPNALFLLDGFTLPVGRTSVPPQWQDFCLKVDETIEEIRQSAPQPEAVINMTGMSLAESVLWAEKVDVYLTPLGTTQHKVGWFTSAPGVIYTSPGVARTVPTRRPGAWEAEGITLPVYVVGTPVDSGQRRGSADFRENLDNVELDPEQLANTLLELIPPVSHPVLWTIGSAMRRA